MKKFTQLLDTMIQLEEVRMWWHHHMCTKEDFDMWSKILDLHDELHDDPDLDVDLGPYVDWMKGKILHHHGDDLMLF